MKQITINIQALLENTKGLDELKNLTSTNGGRVHGDTPMKDIFENFLIARETILNEIKAERFDKISYSRRQNIYGTLSSIYQQTHSWNHVAGQMETLQDQLLISGIYTNAIGHSQFVEEFNELIRLKRSVTGFKEKYEGTLQSLEFIGQKEEELKDLLEKIEQEFEHLHSLNVNAKTEIESIENNKIRSKESTDIIKEVEADVEETKLSITTFFQNIEEYKKRIAELEIKASEVIKKEEEIKRIITLAREAMKLGSAQGISAAFIAQYETASNKKLYQRWVWGAGVSLAIAVGLTVWAFVGYGIKNPDSISSILGRVVAVIVTVSAAAFCAKQYVTQKQLAEDYAYKAVLSKSITAFTEEIATSVDDKNEEEYIRLYLTKVLDEIHKDPLRSRKESKQNNLSDESLDRLNKLAEILNKMKSS